ncbi:cysteine--tRNA ligase [Paenibacillus chondroitinus]|uniref:Cysteine--tRNA ligase n=1 Tax=Paenibacillus chondroitinus TaxID=59842 RepID=A0ABU6DHY9_9BACL|nr:MULTISPECIES: cysteine--tRNA ligase [Paenibacillus]MCY9659403.1 cysteine--tRNA ligase [Paenibacillus anseongense]MEB4797161.1 cysteine--tRNA ligase [Paenibacillus chondroitinus]
MTLRMYNTLTRKKEEFVPLEPGKVKMYVCGPTVYNYIHIGNGRPVIFFDVVRRFLESQNYEVTYITNFTDVDDKMIRKAEEMAVTVPELAETFIAAFLEDIQTLGVHEATLNPRVTDNIQEIIEFIAALVEKGYAYEARGDVYYRTTKFAEYGKLSHQNLEELQYGIRIEVDDRKENPQDFVLWKAAKPGEIYWDSPWGQGRPGWHIECSAMVRKYLGETIDIHGGGQDLTFPHHECEIAQTEAVTGHPMANYWLHNAFLNIDNEKMSKSLGNGILIRDLVKQIKPEVFRFFMLSAHYRNPLNFSDESLKQAANALERIQNANDNLKHRLATASVTGEIEAAHTERVAAIAAQFVEKMNDDFNTPDAITAVFDLVAEANLYLQQERVNAAALQMFLDQLQVFDQTLGILSKQADELLDEEIEQLIVDRTEARKSKNWARADEIRDLLTEKGIFLEDTPQGIRWRRK